MCQILNSRVVLPSLSIGLTSAFFVGSLCYDCEYRRKEPVLRGLQCREKDNKNINQNLMSCSKQCYEEKKKEEYGGKIWQGVSQESSLRRDIGAVGAVTQEVGDTAGKYIEKSICGRGHRKVSNIELERCFAYLWKSRSPVWLEQREKAGEW